MYRIICGDAFDVLDTLDDNSVDMIFTSPTPETFRLLDMIDKTKRILKDSGSLWVQMGDYHDDNGCMKLFPEQFVIDMVFNQGWILRSKIVWHRPDNSRQEDFTRFKRDCEHLFFFTKSGFGYYFDARNIDVSSSYRLFPFIIPTEGFASGFPEGLIELAINACTKPGDTILDPFCDSATTGVVALKARRKFIGIEIDKDKISLINKRLRKV